MGKYHGDMPASHKAAQKPQENTKNPSKPISSKLLDSAIKKAIKGLI